MIRGGVPDAAQGSAIPWVEPSHVDQCPNAGEAFIGRSAGESRCSSTESRHPGAATDGRTALERCALASAASPAANSACRAGRVGHLKATPRSATSVGLSRTCDRNAFSASASDLVREGHIDVELLAVESVQLHVQQDRFSLQREGQARHLSGHESSDTRWLLRALVRYEGTRTSTMALLGRSAPRTVTGTSSIRRANRLPSTRS